MDLERLLEERADAILDHAARRLRAARLPHYDRDGETALAARLSRLLAVLRETAATRRTDSLAAYAEGLALERFADAFELFEVQTAINALEEAAWDGIVARIPPAEQARALGVVTTALGLVKDAVARRYVALATGGRARSLDMTALFDGT